MAKVALLVGVSEYEPGLNPLPGSVKDVDAMQQVLAHPDLGGFAETDITVLKNPQRQAMEDAIYSLFSDRKKDDLLLFYFSGHGIKDENGRLYLATRATRKDSNGRLVPPSAVAAASLHENINASKSQRQVMILDCCFSGAIAQGMTVKDDGTVNLKDYLGGKGRAILTSSTSTEYSFGSATVGHEDAGLSIYTRYLVEGIEKGAADTDGDGWIAVEELHEYAASRVKEAAPAMTPKFYPVEEGYKIVLARSRKDDPKLKYRKEAQARAEQGQGKFSVFAQKILEDKRNDWGISPEEAETITDEVLQPYREYQRKLDEYEQLLKVAMEIEYPFSPVTESDLKDYQKHLSLRDSDISAIEARVLAAHKQTSGDVNVNQQEFPFELKTHQDLQNSQEPLTGKAKVKEGLRRTKARMDQEHLGFTLQTQGKLEAAVAAYRKAIQIDPNHSNVHNNLGFILAEQGNLEEAITEFQTAIQLDPNYAKAYHGLGEILRVQGKLDEAITAYQKAIQLDAKDALPHCGLGQTLNRQGKLDEATTAYQKAIQLNPNYASAYFRLGSALREQSKLDEAVIAYQKAIQLNPNYAHAHGQLGVVLKEKGKLDEAVMELQRSIQLNTKGADYAATLCGDIFEQQGKLGEAIIAYQKATELNPALVYAHHKLGRIFFKQGRLDEAVIEFQKAIQLEPNEESYHNNLGASLEQQGKLDEAVIAYKKAVQLNPDYANAYQNLGDVLLNQEKLDEANAAFRKVIQLDPNKATAHDNLGIVLSKQGKTKEVNEAYRRAEQLGLKKKSS